MSKVATPRGSKLDECAQPPTDRLCDDCTDSSRTAANARKSKRDRAKTKLEGSLECAYARVHQLEAELASLRALPMPSDIEWEVVSDRPKMSTVEVGLPVGVVSYVLQGSGFG